MQHWHQAKCHCTCNQINVVKFYSPLSFSAFTVFTLTPPSTHSPSRTFGFYSSIFPGNEVVVSCCYVVMLKSQLPDNFQSRLHSTCEQQTYFRSSLLSLRPEIRLLFAGYLHWTVPCKGNSLPLLKSKLGATFLRTCSFLVPRLKVREIK